MEAFWVNYLQAVCGLTYDQAVAVWEYEAHGEH